MVMLPLFPPQVVAAVTFVCDRLENVTTTLSVEVQPPVLSSVHVKV